jgi:hypothetical protein
VRSTAGIPVKIGYGKYLPEVCKSRMVPGVANLSERKNIQGNQKVSVHLTITIQKVTSNVQSVPRQSPDIY